MLAGAIGLTIRKSVVSPAVLQSAFWQLRSCVCVRLRVSSVFQWQVCLHRCSCVKVLTRYEFELTSISAVSDIGLIDVLGSICMVVDEMRVQL
jgi:hypothetical protein